MLQLIGTLITYFLLVVQLSDTYVNNTPAASPAASNSTL